MSGSTVGVSLAGITYQFARRRYGRTTYTWVTAVLPDGTQLDLGDPWPCLTPKRAEMEDATRRAVAGHQEQGGCAAPQGVGSNP